MPPNDQTTPQYSSRKSIPEHFISGLKRFVQGGRLRIIQTVDPARVVFRHHPLLTTSIAVMATSGIMLGYTLLPRQVQFSFSVPMSCSAKVVPLPGLHRASGNNSAYEVNLNNPVSLMGLNIVSREVCVTPKSAPTEHSTETVRFAFMGNGILRHSVKVSAQAYPQPGTKKLQHPISVQEPLELELSSSDELFDYALKVSDKQVMCKKDQTTLTCPVAELSLRQGGKYELQLVRMHKGGTVGKIYEGVIRTAEPVRIMNSSVGNNATVYEPVQQIRFVTDKQLTKYEAITLHKKNGSLEEEVPLSAELSGADVVVASTQPLERRANFVLRIKNLYASDNGQLDAPVEINFMTSGGPKVLSANIPASKAELTRSLQVNFDQDIKPGQNLSSIISLTSGATAIPFSAKIQGSRVTIIPRSLSLCTSYTIKFNANLESPFGIKGDSSWSYNFRTRCGSVATIGYSVHGRAILAYRFGTGPSKIIFVGGMHGSEKSSYHTMVSWIDELENNPERIPANRTIIVIPNSNPDGTAVNRRTNANNVDLNRNFPANDWTPGVYMPGPTFAPEGGGSVALSEPESKALASYVQSQSPRLVLTYHAVAAVVIGNGSGDSEGLAATYASKSRYNVAHDSHADDIFSYSTTGEFEDWLHDKLGVPALLIELATISRNEFSRNRDALWAMVAIP